MKKTKIENMVKKPNIFNYISASIRFTIFVLWVIPCAIFALFVPTGTAFGPKFLRFFMRILMWFAGLKYRVHGKLSSARPLLVVGNHISVFEMAVFPAAFGNSFFAKKEIERYPLIGWIAKKFGVIYVDRRPAKALEALAAVRDQMSHATWPMGLYPEGTTTNGAYVKEFKSTLFNFMENEGGVGGATIQPVILTYRNHDGSKISDEDLAEHYALFNNRDQTQGPRCSYERNLIAQVFHIFVLNGFLVELYVLPPPPLAGIKDRKELAAMLHKIISEKYSELK